MVRVSHTMFTKDGVYITLVIPFQEANDIFKEPLGEKFHINTINELDMNSLLEFVEDLLVKARMAEKIQEAKPDGERD